MSADPFNSAERSSTMAHKVPRITYSRRHRSVALPPNDPYAFTDIDDDHWLKGRRATKRMKNGRANPSGRCADDGGADNIASSSSQPSEQKSSPSVPVKNFSGPLQTPEASAVLAPPVINAPQKSKLSPRKRPNTNEPLTEHVNESWNKTNAIKKSDKPRRKVRILSETEQITVSKNTEPDKPVLKPIDPVLSSSPDELDCLPLGRLSNQVLRDIEKARKKISSAQRKKRDEIRGPADLSGPLATSTPNEKSKSKKFQTVTENGDEVSPIEPDPVTAELPVVLPPMNKGMRDGIRVYRDVPDMSSTSNIVKPARAGKSARLSSVESSHVRRGRGVRREDTQQTVKASAVGTQRPSRTSAGAKQTVKASEGETEQTARTSAGAKQTVKASEGETKQTAKSSAKEKAAKQTATTSARGSAKASLEPHKAGRSRDRRRVIYEDANEFM